MALLWWGKVAWFAAASAMCLAEPPPAGADTLEQALINAYRNNPQLNSQRAAVRQADEMVPQALSGYRPTISATASLGEQNLSVLSKSGIGPGGGPAYPRSSATFLSKSVGLTVSQTLYNGSKTANKTRQAESQTSAAREALLVAEQMILLSGATAYMDLLRDGALLRLQRRNVAVLQEQLRQTRDRFTVQEVTRTDVAQAETRLSQGRAAVLAAEAQQMKSKAVYREIIGIEAGTLEPAAAVDRLTPQRMGEAIEIARAHHPAVGAAMFGIDAAVQQVKINEGSLYPVVTLNGSVQQQWAPEFPSELQQFNAYVIGQITVPIYQGGQEYSQIRQAKEAAGQKRIDLDATRDRVQANVVTTWAQLAASKAQILATQAQVASAEAALDGARQEARVGQRTTLDVLNAQQELVNARSAVVTAQRDRVVASYALLAAIGELNLPKLGINIPLYDPTMHFQQIRDAWIGVRSPDGR